MGTANGNARSSFHGRVPFVALFGARGPYIAITSGRLAEDAANGTSWGNLSTSSKPANWGTSTYTIISDPDGVANVSAATLVKAGALDFETAQTHRVQVRDTPSGPYPAYTQWVTLYVTNVIEAPVNTVAPAISGTPYNGQYLSCSTGTWTDMDAGTYAYQWKADGVNIGGATASTFLLTGTQVGAVVTCAVTATNAAGNATATSAATAAVTDPPDTTAPILTLATAVKTGDTTASIGATSNEASGRMYVVASTSATVPTGAQIIAGHDHTGGAAAAASDSAVASTGAKAVAVTGLTGSSVYYGHSVQRDTAGNVSNVVTAGPFTTDAPSPAAAWLLAAGGSSQWLLANGSDPWLLA